jgi:riboflavin transporter FmnP
MQTNTKKLTVLAMLTAAAFIVMAITRPLPPIVLFLQYDPKDVVITIGGFLFGPLSAFAVSAVVAFLEMITVSDSGPYGMLMNIVSTSAFACTAAAVYKRKRNLRGAVVGLAVAWLTMTAVMMLWNYFIAPLYMSVPRDVVVPMLLPAFLPFNLLKAGMNAGITMLLYKPVITALRAANLMPKAENTQKAAANVGLIVLSLFVVATCVLLMLVVGGRI